MDAKLKEKLTNRIEKGTLRSLSSFDGFADFFSNDYLGFARESVNFKGSHGSTGSRLLSGNTAAHLASEQAFATFFDTPAALCFNSGYDANLGVFSAIPQKGDTVIYDQWIHASVRDGIRLSWADSYAFLHNDVADLEKKLTRAKGTVYVAIESLYSMDGDLAPLKEIAILAAKYNAYLIVDEAHACGVLGDRGRGLVSELKLNAEVFLRLVTFGKAYGSHGACVLASEEVRDYLINFSRPFIYSTALPASSWEHNASIVKNQTVASRQQDLQDRIAYFRAQCSLSLISDARSPIQILEPGSIETTRLLAEKLVLQRIAVKPIFTPTVPEGRERIRICLHAFNTFEEIDFLCHALGGL